MYNAIMPCLDCDMTSKEKKEANKTLYTGAKLRHSALKSSIVLTAHWY